jgi:outer membrane protein
MFVSATHTDTSSLAPTGQVGGGKPVPESYSSVVFVIDFAPLEYLIQLHKGPQFLNSKPWSRLYPTADRSAARKSRKVAPPVICLCAALCAVASADPMTDTFQADVFGTSAALHRRTQGLADPWIRNCELPSNDLSLSNAIDLALCRNPATRAAWAAAHQQAAALGAAESAWLPSISGNGTVERSFGPHQDDSGVITSNDQTTRDAAINLTWTLYDFGSREGRIRSTRHLLDAAASTADRTTQQTILGVVHTYYGVVAAEASLAAAEATESTAQRSWDIAKTLREGGVATLADALQAETAYEQAVLARVQAAQNAQSSKGELAVAMGLTANQPLKLAAEPVPAQAPALVARMEDLMAQAQRQRPDLAAARAEVDSAVADIAVARAAGQPSISIAASRSYIDQSAVPGQTSASSQKYNQIGINITVPVFTGFSVDYRIRQAQAALQAREANVEQIRLNVTLDVWNAYFALESSNQQLGTTSILTNTANSNQEVAIGRYRAGVGTILDVLTAQAAAATARQLRITTELDWRLARAQLALALGRLSSAQPLAETTSLP